MELADRAIQMFLAGAAPGLPRILRRDISQPFGMSRFRGSDEPA